jgi:sulfatase maturation enzyme AslB (radical SAM superfamily)
MQIIETGTKKILKSKDYNFVFDKETGFFMRWGKSYFDDPQMSSHGPEILDLEISSGKCMGNCEFCYKENGKDINSHNMSFDEFKIILDKMPPTLTQIAFGICDIG